MAEKDGPPTKVPGSVTADVPSTSSGGRGLLEFATSPFTCCGTHTRKDGARRRHFRCNFLLMFTLIAVLKVAVACVLIWYIGYRAANLTVNRLTVQLRAAVLRDALFEVNTALASPIRAAHHLRFMTQNRWPDFGDRLTVTNETGWLADLSFIEANYPLASRVTIVNKHDLLVGLWSPNSGNTTSPLASTGQVVVEIGEPTTADATTERYQQFQAHPIHNVSFEPPFIISGDVLPTDSAAAIAKFVGTNPMLTIDNFTIFNLPFWTAAEEIAASGLKGGWSDPYFWSAPPIRDGFFGIAALSVVPNSDTGLVDWIAMTVLEAADLHSSILATLDIGPHGSSYLIRPQGRCMATSSVELTQRIIDQRDDIDMRTSTDLWLPILFHTLSEWGLVTDAGITTRNASSVIPYRSTLYERSLSVQGESWAIQAKMVDITQSGLPFVIVIVSRDADFQGGIAENNITAVWLSVLVCVIAIFVSIVAVSCITRPLLHLIEYMDRAVTVIGMDRSENQRVALAQLCDQWAGDSDTQQVPTTSKAQDRRMMILAVPDASPLQPSRHNTFRCLNFGRGMHEVRLMQRAFGSMLFSLASYDELEAINQAKRAFIRYIFHEVRVPFNAIVLGIDQMQLEVKSLSRLNHAAADPAVASTADHQREQTATAIQSCVDTLAILHEQSDVVSHILNDVLSMQKIEDGALALEFEAFSLECMLRGALFAFRSACVEKRLRVDLKMESLDSALNAYPGYIPWLRRDPVACAERVHTFSEARYQADGSLRGSNTNSRSNSQRLFGDPFKQSPRNPLRGVRPSPLPSPVSSPALLMQVTSKQMAPPDPNGPIELGTILPLPCIGPNCSTHHDDAEGDSSEACPREVVYHAQIKADGYRLRQVVANFISNSIKFTPAEGSLTVSLEFSDFVAAAEPDPNDLPPPQQAVPRRPHSPGSPAHHHIDIAEDELAVQCVDAPTEKLLGTIQLKLIVADTGVGISPENAKQMFEEYTQVAANKNQAGGGTGLGLSISKSIVELHGGRIAMQSTPGLGSEFWFTIPAQVLLVEGGRHSRLGSSVVSSSHGTTSAAARAAAVAAGVAATSTAYALQGVPPLLSTGPAISPTEEYLLTVPISNGSRGVSHVTFHLEAQPRESTTLTLPPSDPSREFFLRHPSTGASSDAQSLQQVSSSSTPSFPAQGMLGHSHMPAQDLANFVQFSSVTPTPDRSIYTITAMPLPLLPLPTSIISNLASANHMTPIALPVAPPWASPVSSTPFELAASPPICLPPADSTPSSRQSSHASSGSTIPVGMRVLVVEDSVPNRKLLMSLLKHIKCETEGVENGRLCVDLFPVNADTNQVDQPFDCVIMDGSMPVMNGVEATQILRARGVSIPIIALTGNALAEDQAAFISAGASIVLTKPINRSALQKTLAQWAPKKVAQSAATPLPKVQIGIDSISLSHQAVQVATAMAASAPPSPASHTLSGGSSSSSTTSPPDSIHAASPCRPPRPAIKTRPRPNH